MATKDFLLPDLGEGLTEGEIVSWLVAVGDTIELNQPVAEIETAKAVVEVPSPFAGTVTALHGEVGQEVEVGKPLVTIDLGGEDAAAGAPAGGETVVAASEPHGGPGGVAADAAAGNLVPDDGRSDDGGDGGSGNVLVGYGTGGGGGSRRRRQAAANGGGAAAPSAPPSQPAPPAGPARQGRPLAKPPVRKLARDKGIDLAAVQGTGPDGIITREDVLAHADDGGAAAAAPAALQAAPETGVLVTDTEHHPLGSAAPNEVAPLAPREERIPVRGVRRAISDKMTISRREIPDATTWVDVDATGLWELRAELNAKQAARPDGVKITPLALILRACAAGLRDIPMVNARLDVQTNEIVVPEHVNLGFAAQTDRGLVVPVIKDAHKRSVVGIARELNRLAAAARDGKVKPDEMTGGTFTVSNYGSFGVDGGSPIINHPEAAILGVGRIVDRPWVHNGKVKVRKVMQLSIAFDHRICDGGEAAVFLRFVADCVEDPTTMLASL